MLKRAILLGAVVVAASAIKAEDNSVEDLRDYRCVSNGFRQPLRWGKASCPRIFSRFRRKALVDLSGKLKLVFPTYYMSHDKPIREIPFPNSVEIEAGIEPDYKMGCTQLETSPRLVGDRVVYKKGDADTFKIITVDLGDRVIRKGQWFGVWVALENLDGENFVPESRPIGSSKAQIFETSYTSAKTSFLDDDFIRTAKKIRPVKQSINWVMGYCPAAILAKTDYHGDVWGIVGSSIPEGIYDKTDDQYGDANANIGYADKLISTRLGAPSVNLAKGADRLMYCAAQMKGRLDILKLCRINKVHVALGGNDISGRRKVRLMKTDSLAVVNQLRALSPGIVVYGTTILPHAKSTDNFQTVDSQTPTYGNEGPNSIRGRWNQMLRTNPAEAGYDAVYELCSFVEVDWKNSASRWAANGAVPKAFTPDGTHPSGRGSAAIAENAFLIKPAAAN
jgi:lysophospholipase L1-like esterase